MSPIRIETGPMFSSKSTTLVALVERLEIADKVNGVDFLVFNHASDTRYGVNRLSTHSQFQVEAIAVHDAMELLFTVAEVANGQLRHKEQYQHLETILIDEAQFFDDLLPAVVDVLRRQLRIENIYIAGLDTDFRGETFGPMGDLMALADHVEKHTAICKKQVNGKTCGQPATKTQRLVNGQPANYHDPIILVGAEDSYTARCEEHHEVPDKPPLKL